MPVGVYKKSAEHKRKIGETLKRVYSVIGKPNPRLNKKCQRPFAGRKHSEESNQKNRLAHTLSNHPCWKGGISKHKNYKRFKKLEYQGRKIANGGFHTKGDWENLKAQYNWTCLCCKKSEPEIKLTEDHIIPLIKGGSDNIENIQPLCTHCNFVKHTKSTDYR